MKQITGLVILLGASAFAAAQSPTSSTGTDSSHATAPASTTSTTPAATSSTSPASTTTTSSNVSVKPQSSSSTEKKDDFKVPSNYKRVVRGGEERFCRYDPIPNSRVQKQEVCLTQEQLQAEARGSQDFIQNVQRNSGTAMYSQPNGAGGR